MPAARHQAGPPGRGKFVLLGAMSALGSMAVHMFVPAMPFVGQELGASTHLIQLAISIYLAGLAIGQLSSGFLSDLVGRRPVMLGGIGVFACGSVLVGAAPGILVLLLGRLLQSLGGAALLTTGRAVVMESSTPETAHHNMAGLAMIVLISPALSPALSGMLIYLIGWRAEFLLLGGIAVALGVAGARMLHAPAGGNTRAPRVPHMMTWLSLLRNVTFLRLALANGLLSLCLYTFLAAFPFVLGGSSADPRALGLWLVPIACCAILGARLLRGFRHVEMAQRTGLALMVTAIAGLVVFGMTDHNASPAWVIGPMSLFGLGSGLTGPIAQSRAIASAPQSLGTASSLFGALQMGISASGSVIVAAMGIHEIQRLGLVLLVIGVAGAVAFPGQRAVPHTTTNGGRGE